VRILTDILNFLNSILNSLVFTSMLNSGMMEVQVYDGVKNKLISTLYVIGQNTFAMTFIISDCESS